MWGSWNPHVSLTGVYSGTFLEDDLTVFTRSDWWHTLWFRRSTLEWRHRHDSPKDRGKNVHSSLTRNGKKSETTQVAFNSSADQTWNIPKTGHRWPSATCRVWLRAKRGHSGARSNTRHSVRFVLWINNNICLVPRCPMQYLGHTYTSNHYHMESRHYHSWHYFSASHVLFPHLGAGDSDTCALRDLPQAASSGFAHVSRMNVQWEVYLE